MVNKHKIIEIIQEYFGGSDQFLVDIRVSSRNKITVNIDGDKGVTIADCVALSRHIESSLDRDKEDFELEVSSAGIGTPLTMIRQYRNNIGRLISLLLNDESKLRGKLIAVAEEGISIEKEIKKKGKKKKNPDTDQHDIAFISFDSIKEARIIPAY